MYHTITKMDNPPPPKKKNKNKTKQKNKLYIAESLAFDPKVLAFK